MYQFLSTPSARRATALSSKVSELMEISIHALREEGDWPTPPASTMSSYFYPRPPRGGRRIRVSAVLESQEFLSTPSARRATGTMAQKLYQTFISIHALREEGDCKRPATGKTNNEFLSTPSARRATFNVLKMPKPDYLFLSTPSARRATA